MNKFLVALAVLAVAQAANAEIITFDELGGPTTQEYDSPLFLDGFAITNDHLGSNDFLVWGQGNPYNADPDGATLSAQFDNAFTTFAREDGGYFNIISIDLSNIFNFMDGFFNISYLNLDGIVNDRLDLDRKPGLQTFNLNLTRADRHSGFPKGLITDS